ncbi:MULTISPECIES: hypothetical protein [Rhodococcus]|nr:MULTISPECIES: hypothetical protein [Rhodococcus]
MNQIHALLVTAPEQIRATYRNLGSANSLPHSLNHGSSRIRH